MFTLLGQYISSILSILQQHPTMAVDCVLIFCPRGDKHERKMCQCAGNRQKRLFSVYFDLHSPHLSEHPAYLTVNQWKTMSKRESCTDRIIIFHPIDRHPPSVQHNFRLQSIKNFNHHVSQHVGKPWNRKSYLNTHTELLLPSIAMIKAMLIVTDSFSPK